MSKNDNDPVVYIEAVLDEESPVVKPSKPATKMFLNSEDLKRVAAVLSKIHNVSIEEAWMHPEKWLNYEGNELSLVPVLKPTKIASSKESK